MKWPEIFPFAGFVLLSILVSGRVVTLKKKGVKVSNRNNELAGMKYILYPLFILLFLFWLLELVKPVFGISLSVFNIELTRSLTNQVWLKIAGSIFILISILIMALTLHHFKISLRFGLNKNNCGKLITGGIFSVSRNPFFLSLILYFIGVALVFPSWFFIGFAVLAVISIHFFILKEERFLKKVYKEEYKIYSEKVRRYL
jgi:protein-S-isoprenylcysteine O-methyltransferase Ste14